MSATIKSFLEREKHDLRDKSNKDDERKKARERESSSYVYHLVKVTRIFLKKE